MRDIRKNKKVKRTKAHKPNSFVLIFASIMLIFGTIMIFDASVFQANQIHGDQFYFFKRQILWIIVGLFPASILYFWDYRKYSKLFFPALIINIILLIAVLIFGEDLNGSKRWFTLGRVTIQPAEFIKPIIIVFYATLFSKYSQSKKLRKSNRDEFLAQLVSFLIVLAIVLLLVLLEPDLGTTMIVGLTSFAIFYLSGQSLYHTAGSIATGVIFLVTGAVAAMLESYRLSRVKTFFDLIISGEVTDPKGSGYQMQQILIGIGSAPIWGKGFGQSRQRYGFLVENTAFTDSIFAVVVEELGLIGGTIFVIAWIGFLIVGLNISSKAPDKLGQLIAAGITIWLTLQALLNMAANVGLIPLTGIPLPFLTYGGSNTIVTIIGIAILLNVSRFTIENEATR